MKKSPSTTLMNNLWSMIIHVTEEKDIFRFISALKKKKRVNYIRPVHAYSRLCECCVYPGTCMSKNKTTEFNNNSLYLCQTFRFISCPDSFRQEQNVMFELLQVQFLRFIDIFWQRLMHSTACGG